MLARREFFCRLKNSFKKLSSGASPVIVIYKAGAAKIYNRIFYDRK
jgi:hypothetical protein